MSFLDVRIDRSQGRKPSTSIFRKATFTGLMVNILSYDPLHSNVPLSEHWVHIGSTKSVITKQFPADLLELKHILARNLFPPRIVENKIKSYQTTDGEGDVEKLMVNFFKLPLSVMFWKRLINNL